MTMGNGSDDKKGCASPAVEQQPSSARQRTERWLRNLLLAGAAVQVSGCPETVVCDPLPPPYDAGHEGKQKVDLGRTKDARSDTSVVCDPLPPPVECANDPKTSYFMSYAYWSGKWRKTGTAFLIDVKVEIYTWVENLTFAGGSSATGAQIQSSSVADRLLTLTCAPQAASIDLVVPLNCKGVSEQIKLRLDASAPADGQAVSISLGE